MRTLRYLLLLAAMAAVVLPVRAAQAGYSRGGPFTAPGYGARAWGMAGASVAQGCDEGAVFWNPALLGCLERPRLGLSYIDLVPGTSAQQTYLAYARAYQRAELDEPGLVYNTHAWGLIYSNLRLDLADGLGHSENVLRLGYAYSPQHAVSVGVGFSVLIASSDIDGFDAKGTSVDAGLRVALLPSVTLGVMARNLFSRVQYDDSSDLALSRAVTVGAAFRATRNGLVEGDAIYAFGSLSRLAAGGEYVFFKTLALRAGVAAFTAGDSRTVAYFGMGVNVSRLKLDYNVNLDEESAFENTHRFAVGIGL